MNNPIIKSAAAATAAAIVGMAFAFAFAFVGCAEGSTADSSNVASVANQEPEQQAAAKIPPPSQPPSSESSPADPSTPDAGNGGNAGTPQSDAGAGASTCGTPANTCMSPTTTTTVLIGDNSGPTATFTGTTSQWFRVRVHETQNDLFDSDPLRVKAMLTSPPGSNFDVFLYHGNTPSEIACSVVRGAAQSTTSPEELKIQWGDSDDGDRWLSAEVRYISGPCTAPWTLTLGNW